MLQPNCYCGEAVPGQEGDQVGGPLHAMGCTMGLLIGDYSCPVNVAKGSLKRTSYFAMFWLLFICLGHLV